MRVACPIDSMGYIKKNAEDAEYLAFFDIEEEEILSEEKAPLSIHDISSILKLKDVDVFICTNMDIPLMVSLSKNDIEIVGGASGKAKMLSTVGWMVLLTVTTWYVPARKTAVAAEIAATANLYKKGVKNGKEREKA